MLARDQMRSTYRMLARDQMRSTYRLYYIERYPIDCISTLDALSIV